MIRPLRRLFLTLFALSFFTLSGRTAEPPNIIFFLSDDHRADLLGCAGHPIVKTPVIDGLARAGVRFENMFVTTSICAASRASILTGQYERTHGFTFGTPPISEASIAGSYPAVLRDAGYRTGFTGKYGVRAHPGAKEKMFDLFMPVNRSPYFKNTPAGKRHASEIIGDNAIAFLQKQPKDQPFCLSVSFNAAHAEDGDKKDHFPWPKAMNGLYDQIEIPAPSISSDEIFNNHPEFMKNSMNRDRWFWRWDTPEKFQKNVKGYYRMISGLDHVIGRVIKVLGELGYDKNTIIIFSGDNGYYEGRRQFAGKWSHFEDSLRVPLVIFDPRADADQRGKVVSHMALNLDIPTTILDYAGVSQPSTHQGASLRPLVQGIQPSAWRTDFFGEHLMNNARIPKWEGVRGERYVYARYFEQDPVYEYLHDLKSDPQQLRNDINNPEYKKVLERMRSRCDELRDAYGGPYKPRPKKPRKKKS